MDDSDADGHGEWIVFLLDSRGIPYNFSLSNIKVFNNNLGYRNEFVGLTDPVFKPTFHLRGVATGSSLTSMPFLLLKQDIRARNIPPFPW